MTPNQVIVTSAPVAIDDASFWFSILVTSSPENAFCDAVVAGGSRRRRDGELSRFYDNFFYSNVLN